MLGALWDLRPVRSMYSVGFAIGEDEGPGRRLLVLLYARGQRLEGSRGGTWAIDGAPYGAAHEGRTLFLGGRGRVRAGARESLSGI